VYAFPESDVRVHRDAKVCVVDLCDVIDVEGDADLGRLLGDLEFVVVDRKAKTGNASQAGVLRPYVAI
jgi:hypothetical protein